MNEIFLIFVAIGLFFFAYEIRPRIIENYPEHRHLVDLIAMAVTISTILFPLITLIQAGKIFIGSYLIIIGLFVSYLIYYLINNRNELDRRNSRTLLSLGCLYIYVFGASLYLLITVAPYMGNIKI